ncbi:MAG: DUF4270 family protein [Bacteroidota bacterium]|nr:hypothetical protein [Christiangramia sp.]MEE2772848.1 DUF4270 family protein [Bacteroidota bacterium]
MQKTVLAISYLISLCSLLVACSEEETASGVGEDWIRSNTKAYFIDTLTVRSSTFKFDSVQVSSTDRLLIGSYENDIFSRTSASSYLSFLNTTYNLDDDAELDSIQLIMKYDGYYYNDTLSSQTFEIHQVLEQIEPEEDDYFYNTSDFQYDSTVIGALQFKPYTHIQDSIKIPMDYLFGNAIFEGIQQNEINNADDLLREFRGLLVMASANNSAVLGFDKNESYLRFYYSVPDELENEEHIMDFTLGYANSFHHISSERNNGLLEQLSQEEQLYSEETGNRSYMQAGTGISTKIEVPYLERLYDIEGEGYIVSANLKIGLDRSRFRELPVQDSLQFFLVDSKSEILGQLYNILGTDVAYAILTEEDEEYNTASYSLDVKAFLDSKLTEYGGEKWSLAIVPSENNQAVDQYIFFGNMASDEERIKLEITYAIYHEE